MSARYTVRYHDDVGAGWLTQSGGWSELAQEAGHWPTLRAAERAANRRGQSCFTIRSYAPAYFARLLRAERDQAGVFYQDHLRYAAAPDLLAALEAIVACDLSAVCSDSNGELLDAIANAHDLLCKVKS